MRPFALFLLLCLTSPLAAQRRTPFDYGMAIGSTALIVADWSQTSHFPKRDITERNLILGKHPSEGRINTLIGLAVLANVSASFLPKTPRRIWHGVVLVVESWAVVDNLSKGYRIGF